MTPVILSPMSEGNKRGHAEDVVIERRQSGERLDDVVVDRRVLLFGPRREAVRLAVDESRH